MQEKAQCAQTLPLHGRATAWRLAFLKQKATKLQNGRMDPVPMANARGGESHTWASVPFIHSTFDVLALPLLK